MSTNKIKNIFFYGSIITFIIVLIVIIKKRYYSSEPEDFQISLGIIANQHKFYSKCTNDCSRNKNIVIGESSPGQFKWKCIDACQEEAIRRGKMNIPDLNDTEYQRHSQCSTRYSTPNDIEKCHCMNERLEWCKEQYCSFNKGDKSICIKDCLRTRAINCNNLFGGGLSL